MNPIYVPFGIILGLLLLPVHEVLHGVCYKKGQKVYIGICLKVCCFAVCHEPISKRRFVIMSLMPMLLGIIPLAIFLLSPPNAFLSGICIPMGLLVCFLQCRITWMSTLFANKYLKVLSFILKMMGFTGTNNFL